MGKERNMTGTVEDAASLADCVCILSNIASMLLLEQTHTRFTKHNRVKRDLRKAEEKEKWREKATGTN